MDKIYCSNCGKLVSRKANYCAFCGAAQHGPASAVYQAQLPVVVPGSEVTVVPAQLPPEQITEDNYIIHAHLAPKSIWVFFLNYVAKTSAILLVLAVGLFFEPELFLIGIVLYLVVTYAITVLIYNHFYYTIDATGFRKEYGIIHKINVSLPYQQIQNVNITRSLLDRLFGLARISIETAGSGAIHRREIIGGSKSKAEAHLPGVTLVDAKKIHDLLLRKANESQR